MTGYPLIDVLRTGQRLKEACIKKNIEAKEIKQFLGLAAMQSIYNWFQGKALPSLDNFYALSSYLGTELDSLIVPQGLRCFPLLCSGFFLLMEWRSLRPLLQADFHASMKSAHSKGRVNCNTKFSGNPAACVVGEKVPCYNKRMRLARSQCSQDASQP